MFGDADWLHRQGKAMFQYVLDVLWDEDDGAAVALIRALGGVLTATIELFEGDLSVEEAVLYARVLAEMGQVDRALELMTLVFGAAFGYGRYPVAQVAYA
jgi:hypothetical protein